jgi:ribonuclease P protein component
VLSWRAAAAKAGCGSLFNKPYPVAIPISQRIRKSVEIRQVLARGQRADGPQVKIAVVPNDLGVTRFAFSVSKQVGSAVTRNLVKRRMRHALISMHFDGGFDLVVIAKPRSTISSYSSLAKSIQYLLQDMEVIFTNSLSQRTGVRG